MLKFSDFGWGYLTCNGSGEQTNGQICINFYDLSSSIVKVSLKKTSMSLGLVVLEKKLFTRTYADAAE